MSSAISKILTTVIAGLILWYLTTIYFQDSSVPPPERPAAAVYDQLMTAVVPPTGGRNPLSDARVQDALRNYLAPTGTGAADTKRLLAEAGYPDGIALSVSRVQFPGDDGALQELAARLGGVGVRLEVR